MKNFRVEGFVFFFLFMSTTTVIADGMPFEIGFDELTEAPINSVREIFEKKSGDIFCSFQGLHYSITSEAVLEAIGALHEADLKKAGKAVAVIKIPECSSELILKIIGTMGEEK